MLRTDLLVKHIYSVSRIYTIFFASDYHGHFHLKLHISEKKNNRGRPINSDLALEEMLIQLTKRYSNTFSNYTTQSVGIIKGLLI